MASNGAAAGAARKKLNGYVGFANLPNQVHRKSVRKGFTFTCMVVGEWRRGVCGWMADGSRVQRVRMDGGCEQATVDSRIRTALPIAQCRARFCAKR
jgi:hypothetical protein